IIFTYTTLFRSVDRDVTEIPGRLRVRRVGPRRSLDAVRIVVREPGSLVDDASELPVAQIVVDRALRSVDAEIAIVDSDAIEVSILIAQEPSLEHLVGARADARDERAGVERRLL